MENTPTSISGIIIPASWDTDGSILTTAIVTFDEDTFAVADTDSGRVLAHHLRQTVTATGWIDIQGSSKTIQVENFFIHGPDDVAQRTNQ
ncbi:MAG: hypothetical protein V2J08_10165 [Desulfotignum sp.]|jgi:hypothetical protein|nr:hypothetical protein [Desulfotignum sp.]